MKNNKKNGNSKNNNDVQEENQSINPVNNVKEIGGPKGPEPTRYGDWEKRGRCIDF